MLSIERSSAAVVACHASPPALDGLAPAASVHKGRVAPDELLLVAPASRLGDLLRGTTAHFALAEPEALVLDQSDGWALFSLRGDEAAQVFAQLSTVPLPTARPAFVQGAVAGGPAKVFCVGEAIHVLVPSTLGHHLASRLGDVCGPVTRVPAVETPWTGDPASLGPDARAASPARG